MTINIELILTFGGYALAGAVALVGYLNPVWRKQHSEADEASERLVNTLKATVEVQDKKITDLQKEMQEGSLKRDKQINDLSQKVHELQGRNSVLEDILKGRAPGMKALFEEAPQILTIAKENNNLVKSTNQAVNSLTTAIGNLVEELKAHKLTIQ